MLFGWQRGFFHRLHLDLEGTGLGRREHFVQELGFGNSQAFGLEHGIHFGSNGGRGPSHCKKAQRFGEQGNPGIGEEKKARRVLWSPRTARVVRLVGARWRR